MTSVMRGCTGVRLAGLSMSLATMEAWLCQRHGATLAAQSRYVKSFGFIALDIESANCLSGLMYKAACLPCDKLAKCVRTHMIAGIGNIEQQHMDVQCQHIYSRVCMKCVQCLNSANPFSMCRNSTPQESLPLRAMCGTGQPGSKGKT